MSTNCTDVTIEVFNHCAGTCTGCQLSTLERRSVAPVMPIQRFSQAMDELQAYDRTANLNFRALITFGDVPWLPADIQKRYYAAATERGIPLGVTMTFVEEDRRGNYERGVAALLDADPTAVFDITVDPIRLLRQKDYAERLRWAIQLAPELHLTMLLSEAILARSSPEDLAAMISTELLGRPILLGFTPSIERFSGSNYGYDINTAAAFASRFYAATTEGSKLLADDLQRFDADGRYADFLQQTFHIGPDLRVWPTGYTVFGDVILDERNGGKSLGSIAEDSLGNVLAGKVARRLSVLADAWMGQGGFNCDGCEHRNACAFNGIGAVRELYSEFEFRSGACYGPASLPRLERSAA